MRVSQLIGVGTVRFDDELGFRGLVLSPLGAMISQHEHDTEADAQACAQEMREAVLPIIQRAINAENN